MPSLGLHPVRALIAGSDAEVQVLSPIPVCDRMIATKDTSNSIMLRMCGMINEVGYKVGAAGIDGGDEFRIYGNVARGMPYLFACSCNRAVGPCLLQPFCPCLTPASCVHAGFVGHRRVGPSC